MRADTCNPQIRSVVSEGESKKRLMRMFRVFCKFCDPSSSFRYEMHYATN